MIERSTPLSAYCCTAKLGKLTIAALADAWLYPQIRGVLRGWQQHNGATSLPMPKIGPKNHSRITKRKSTAYAHDWAHASGVIHMAFTLRASTTAFLLVGGIALAGCAGDGSDAFTTGSLSTQQTAAAEPKVDPQCVALNSRIDVLRKEGIADKIEKAAIKKYKMTQADLGKADQLTKANAEFQMRCASVTKPTTAQAPGQQQPMAAAPVPKGSTAVATAASAN